MHTIKYALSVVALLWATQSLSINIVVDKDPSTQHLTALAIKLDNPSTQTYILPNQLVNTEFNYLSVCDGKENNPYCGEHASTCQANQTLAPMQSCLIWLAARLSDKLQQKHDISVTILPGTSAEKKMAIAYQQLHLVGGVDFLSFTPDTKPLYMGSDSEIRALTIFNSDLYAGGRFSLSNASQTINNLACWNGHTWSSLEKPIIKGGVYSLASWQKKLFVGGMYMKFDSSDADIILASWDGKNWTRWPSDRHTAFIFSLLPTASQLYFAGNFSKIGDFDAENIASYDGECFHALNQNINQSIFSLAEFQGHLYAGGENNLSAYDQKTWHALPIKLNGGIYALASTNHRLYLGGDLPQFVQYWDGEQFHLLHGGVNNSVYSLLTFANQLFVGGGFSQAGGQAINYLARFIDDDWQAINHSEIPSFVNVQLIAPQLVAH